MPSQEPTMDVKAQQDPDETKTLSVPVDVSAEKVLDEKQALSIPVDINPEDIPDESNALMDLEEPVKKKKKRKNKKKKKTQPTGFEESYAEPPMTVAQAQEIARIYSTDIPLPARMETCIQRYRARRKWDPARHAIFSRFLVLGGVRSGQKSYGGGLNLEGRVSEDEEGPDAEEIAMQTATDYVCSFEISNRNSNDWKGTPGVFDDEEEKEEWWVDFEHVVKGFLSYVIPHIMCYHTEADLLLGVSIVRNFLNYVILHDVALDYTANIYKALDVCKLAESELLLCTEITVNLPGPFNMACSAIFGGHYKGLYEADVGTIWEGKPENHSPLGMRLAEAEQVYKEALKKVGTETQKKLGLERVSIRRKDNIGFEVQKIHMPSPDDGRGKLALGFLDCEIWVPEGERLPYTPLKKFQIFLEKQTLIYMFPKLKLEATVYTLSNGMYFMDTITGIYCSFYTYLEAPSMGDGEGEFEEDY